MQTDTLANLARQLQTKKRSAQELTTHYLERIKKLDNKLNSFITVEADKAIQAAKQADNLLHKNQAPSALTGIPIAHKDIFCTQGTKTSCGSKMLDNFIAPYNATVIEKFNQAGCVNLGKTNMDEFAMGSSNETSFYGPVNNPWDLNCVPGGSSGGSAAAVAARLAPGATGTDTGGSIRQPAAFCGLTGIKPTYGRVSRFGMIAFASSLDQGGPLAKTAEDCALLLEVMSGFDPKDSTSIDTPVPQYTQSLGNKIAGVKIGLPKEFFNANLSTENAKLLEAAIKVLEQLGASITEISLQNIHLAIPTYYVIAPAECSSNLSRFDGVRFGHRCRDPKNLLDLYKRSRAEGFGQEVKRRILVGTYVLSAGYYDAYYLQAQKIRALIRQTFQSAFQTVDVILSPTTPTPAFKLGEKTVDPVSMYLSDIYTSAVNLAGLPGLSMPAGTLDKLPMGVQLIGNYFTESLLLNIAHQYQQETSWHQLVPTGFE